MGECYCESKEWYSFVSFDDCFADKSATSHEELSQYTDGLKYMFAAYKITEFKRATKHITVKDVPKSYKIVVDEKIKTNKKGEKQQ